MKYKVTNNWSTLDGKPIFCDSLDDVGGYDLEEAQRRAKELLFKRTGSVDFETKRFEDGRIRYSADTGDEVFLKPK